MSSKEITTFVVDLSLSMGQGYDKNETDLTFGLKYLYHNVINKIVRARKTDFVTLITCHSKQTNNPFSDGTSFSGIDVVANKVVPEFSHLKEFDKILRPNVSSNDSQSDCVEAMMVGVGLMQKDARLKFIRNIVIITNAEDPIKSFDSKLYNASIDAINALEVNVDLIGVKFSDNRPKTTVKMNNEKTWTELIANYKNGHVIDAFHATRVIDKNPPLKKVEPRKLFHGALRFGNDVSHLQGDERLGTSSNGGLSFNVEVYPAIRQEKLPSFHQYLLNENGTSLLKVTTENQYFIYKNDDTKDNQDEGNEKDNENDTSTQKKVVIPKNDWTDGYKYSNLDLHSVDADLSQTAKLPSNPSMDIIGFIETKNLPRAYFTDEANYVIPASMSSPKEYMGFNSLCQALIELKSAALVRYVPKLDDEIRVCALLSTKTKVGDKYIFCGQLVRLPFREDEKIGTFPPLMDQFDNEETEDKTSEQQTMQNFILSKDLDGGPSIIKEEGLNQTPDDDEFVVENEKVDLKKSQAIGDKLSHIPSDINHRLLSHNPAIHKFSMNLNKIIRKAASASDLHLFLNDPNFFQKYMTSDNLTNLFNMRNILLNDYAVDRDDWLHKLNKKSVGLQQGLATHTKPYNPESRKRRKGDQGTRLIQRGGNYGNDVIEEEFDIDAILAGD